MSTKKTLIGRTRIKPVGRACRDLSMKLSKGLDKLDQRALFADLHVLYFAKRFGRYSLLISSEKHE